jgi:hypothetical protein
MLRRMSSQELTEWMAFYSLEPFGREIEMYGHAITASTIANVNRDKNSKPFKPGDFVPKFQLGEQGVNEQLQIAEMFTAALGGSDLRED